MCFGPSGVKEGILSIEPGSVSVTSYTGGLTTSADKTRKGAIPFLCLYALRCKAQNKQPSVADKSKVRGGCHRYAGVEEGRVLNGESITALCAKFKHGADGDRKSLS